MLFANIVRSFPTLYGHPAQSGGQSNRKLVEYAPSGTERSFLESRRAWRSFTSRAKIISRGKGQSAIAAAAYRSGERLRDEQANEQKFYQARAERIEFTDIMAPKDAPEWAHDRNAAMERGGAGEKRKDAQLAREIEVSLPHELTRKQRVWLVKDFAREAFVRKGYAVDIAIHAPGQGERRTQSSCAFDGDAADAWAGGFRGQERQQLERAGAASRSGGSNGRTSPTGILNGTATRRAIDHRSLKEQGIEREPGMHLGYAANEMARRGAQSDRMDALKGVIERNDIREQEHALCERLFEVRTTDQFRAVMQMRVALERARREAMQEALALGCGGSVPECLLATTREPPAAPKQDLRYVRLARYGEYGDHLFGFASVTIERLPSGVYRFDCLLSCHGGFARANSGFLSYPSTMRATQAAIRILLENLPNPAPYCYSREQLIDMRAQIEAKLITVGAH